VTSIAAKIGCTPRTLHDWVKKAEVDSGQRAGVLTGTVEKLKALERENRELRQQLAPTARHVPPARKRCGSRGCG
jgi:transposase-like protein